MADRPKMTIGDLIFVGSGIRAVVAWVRDRGAPLGDGVAVYLDDGSCTASVRLIPGVLSKPVCVRNMSLSAGLQWGGYGVPHLRMLVC
jgi:hypothetical protein